jgi:hypothetical protein
MTIKIFERQIPAPTPQQVMDAIREDEEKAALVTEIGDATIGSALYSQRGRGGRRRYGRQKKHRCTYCKMDNHTTEACGKRKHAQQKNSENAAGRRDERTCYHCGLPGHLKAKCIHYLRAKEQRGKVTKGSATATASLATAGDCDPF